MNPRPAPTISVGFLFCLPTTKLRAIRHDIREPPIKIRCIIHVIKYNLKKGGCPVKTGIKTIVANIEHVTASTINSNSLTLAYSQAR